MSEPATTTARILRAVLYPATGEVIEIPGDQIIGCGGGGDSVSVVVQKMPDDSIRRWVGLPMMIEHAPPSPIVAPTRRGFGS